ncbi:hypothetical protein HMPREF9373_1089 [Psychrobacter sp. 1501(2011)]|nr:hypothetical protein HMPREF9373_1089 [Psychrobacter sp. 1501(2011)]
MLLAILFFGFDVSNFNKSVTLMAIYLLSIETLFSLLIMV